MFGSRCFQGRRRPLIGRATFDPTSQSCPSVPSFASWRRFLSAKVNFCDGPAPARTHFCLVANHESRLECGLVHSRKDFLATRSDECHTCDRPALYRRHMVIGRTGRSAASTKTPHQAAGPRVVAGANKYEVATLRITDLRKRRSSAPKCAARGRTRLTTRTNFRRRHAGFGNWFRVQCDDAGLPKSLSAHGLRKADATRLAEHGCTDHEIMAWGGWSSLKEVQRYTKAANRKRLAMQAAGKRKAGTEVANLETRLATQREKS
jgi:Phage integrase family